MSKNDMTKINMKLTENDETRLELLKKKTGLTQNTEVLRYCLTKVYLESIKKTTEAESKPS
jgi:hypothetical protein